MERQDIRLIFLHLAAHVSADQGPNSPHSGKNNESHKIGCHMGQGVGLLFIGV